MRCTSSDLIITAPVRCRRRKLASGRRVPKGQKTVKVETIDALHAAPFLEALRDGIETDQVQQPEHGGMQERQVAEAAVQLVVAHRGGGIDILLLGEPGDRGLLVA